METLENLYTNAFQQHDEAISAANPWGCNQYGHRKGHGSSETPTKQTDEDAEYEKQIAKYITPMNGVSEAVKRAKRREYDNEVTNALKALGEAKRKRQNSYVKTSDMEKLKAEEENKHEDLKKAIKEWRRFNKARLKAEGWKPDQIQRWLDGAWPEL
jgi:hypothetical protein